jgi:hypothetical protein
MTPSAGKPLREAEFVPEANLPNRRRAQLCDARHLLGLPQDPTDVDNVREALALIDLDERLWAAGRVEYRKATKGALQKVLSALRRLEQAYAGLPDDYVRARSLDIESIDWHQVRKHTTMFEQDLHAKPKAPFKHVIHRKWFAARVAYQLMHDHGLPIRAQREGKFCRLAAILYGDRKADLYKQCCTVLSKKEPTRAVT